MTTLFPHHDWADADGLVSPDVALASTGYFRNDPDGYSNRLRSWHQLLWSKDLPNGGRLDLEPEDRGLRDKGTGLCLKSDTAVPAWEGRQAVQSFVGQTERYLQERHEESIHDVGWRLYDMGAMVLFPGRQIDGLWTINQAKGCTGSIADRLDLTLECIRRYYRYLHEHPHQNALPADFDQTNPLGSVLHRYRTFFELFGTFEGYVRFWLLDDLTVDTGNGLSVRFLLPREGTDEYDFQVERAMPVDADQYYAYLLAADAFVTARNRLMARVVLQRGDGGVCPGCINMDRGHERWS